jgi:hypothetical protein
LAKATVAALQDPSARDIIRSQAAVVVGNTKAEFGQFIRAESAKYGKIVALTGVRLNIGGRRARHGTKRHEHSTNVHFWG